MTRADLVRTVLVWEAVARQANAKAAEAREQLSADARAELEEQGTAPTWRLPDLATITLPVTKRAIVVADADALTKWAAERRPDDVEVVTQYRPASLKALLAQVRDDDGLTYLDGGESVPGLAVREGGQPRTLTIRPSSDAVAVLDAAAGDIVSAVAAALAETPGADEGGEQ